MNTLSLARAFLIHSILPLSLGGCVYLFLREGNFIFWNWMPEFLKKALMSAQHQFIGLAFLAPDWVKYNLPDGLWAYSLAYSSFLFLSGDSSKRCQTLLLVLIVVNLIELFQLTPFSPGTFDLADLLTINVSTLIAYVFFTKHEK